MMTTAINQAKALAELDKHAEEYNFPAFDNAYLELADARLTALRSASDWVILFEVVGWSSRELQFVNDLYAYGSCVYPEGFQSNSSYVLGATKEQPILDLETNDCIASWDRWSVVINNSVQTFAPTREDYLDAGIKVASAPGPGSIKEVEILRFLVHKLGHKFFESDEQLQNRVPQCKALRKFIQVTEWHHPDVLASELPSHNVAIRSLIEALASDDPSRFIPGVDNTQWKNWLVSD